MCDDEDDVEDDGDEDAIVNYQETEDDDDDPPEMVEEVEDMDDEAINHYEENMAAAEAFITKAKKLRAGAEKLRGFYKRGVPHSDRKNGAKAFKEKAHARNVVNVVIGMETKTIAVSSSALRRINLGQNADPSPVRTGDDQDARKR